MKLKHHFKDHHIERDLHESIPLGFLLSNKTGGLMFFDAKKDRTQLYFRIGDTTLKIIDDIHAEGSIEEVGNRLQSLSVSRGEPKTEFFIPHYMNSLVITSEQGMPVNITFDVKGIDDRTRFGNHETYEKEGRLVVRSSSRKGRAVYTAIQGSKLLCEAKTKKSALTINLMSPKTVLAVAENEAKAISEANHVMQNEQKIRSLQEKYVSSGTDFRDPETALAYACVLNGMDHMLLPDQTREDCVTPLPVLSHVTGHHISIAAHAMLLEGEFGIAKKTLLSEIDKQQNIMEKGSSTFETAAWPVVMAGKLMDRLCSRKKLYTYFSPEDVKSFADKVSRFTVLAEDKHTKHGLVACKDGSRYIEDQALMLSVYNLAFALTKDDQYLESEKKLKSKTQKLINEKLADMEQGKLDIHDAVSLFTAAYAYPPLMAKEEWTCAFDKLLHSMHNNFGVFRRKLLKQEDALLNLELFSLTSMAATVLNRNDPERFEKQVNKLMRSNIKDALYHGIIGRPTSSFRHSVNPEKEAVIQDKHLLNNALFLEMIRECA